jgi:hypothetical protein
MTNKGKHHAQRTASHQKSEPSESNLFFSSFSLDLDCNLMIHSFFDFSFNLLPEDIFGTEEIPEYILSDSSAEEEDATPEQMTNHQLRRRIRHLENDLWDITVRCCAERERCMNLEVVIGDEIFILICTSCSSSDPVFDDNLFLFFRRV